MRFVILPLLLLPLAGPATAAPDYHIPNIYWPHFHWSASVNASTSTVMNDIVLNRAQLGGRLEGRLGNLLVEGSIASAYSGGSSGTDHQDRYLVSYDQRMKPFNLRYQVTLKEYPGTRDGLNDHGIVYGVTASRKLLGLNLGLGLDYSNEDYATIRKSYGMNLSVSRSLAKGLSGWFSVSHHHQFGNVDYTNTNLGIYYQVTSKTGISTSINNWHGYARWNHDRPTLSVSLSRRL